jgi:uncharacterized protein YcfL
MKKNLLLILAVMLLLVGCGSKEKFYLEDSYYGNNKLVEINSEDLKKLEEDKKDFVLFVYLPGCSSCAEFKVVLEDFLKDNNISINYISILDSEGTAVEKKVKYAPSFMVYKDGKVVDLLDSNSNEDVSYFKDANDFKNWLENYIFLSK